MTAIVVKSAAASLAGLGLALSAHAADTNWQLSQPVEEGAKSFLFAEDAGGPSVALYCSDQMGLQAAVHLNGTDLENSAIQSNSKLRNRNVALSTDSMAEKDADWAYVRQAKVLISTKGWQAKRMFNAAIKGEPVQMDIQRVGAYTLTLPPVDDTFKTFAKSCAATS